MPHMLNSNLLSKSSCRPKQPSPLPSHPNQSSKTLLKPMPLVHATVNPRPNRSCVSRAATNSTASTSSHIRRRSGPQVWLQPLRDDEVFYLAYGSNMSPQVLSGRRRVRPHSSVPCYCPGKFLLMPLMLHALNPFKKGLLVVTYGSCMNTRVLPGWSFMSPLLCLCCATLHQQATH